MNKSLLTTSLICITMAIDPQALFAQEVSFEQKVLDVFISDIKTNYAGVKMFIIPQIINDTTMGRNLTCFKDYYVQQKKYNNVSIKYPDYTYDKELHFDKRQFKSLSRKPTRKNIILGVNRKIILNEKEIVEIVVKSTDYTHIYNIEFFNGEVSRWCRSIKMI